MQVKASAFKAYDIRGIVDDALDDAFAEHLGRAFGSEAVRLGEKAVAVGRDGRVSGPRLVAALNHPHICMLYDIGHEDGIDYLVLEYWRARRWPSG